jgi:heme/copper-type cytochrome/quinol oxidase subunit 1
MGMPRRIFEGAYAGQPQAHMWQALTWVSAMGGVILFVSAMFFVLVMLGTLLAGPRRDPDPIVWAEALSPPPPGLRPGIWDGLWPWFAGAVVLAAIAYVIPLWDILHLTRYGSPGFKTF